MTIASFEGKTPHIGAGTYIHPSTDVFGDVTIGEGCWIGPGVRIRGDYGAIIIGDYSSVGTTVSSTPVPVDGRPLVTGSLSATAQSSTTCR